MAERATALELPLDLHFHGGADIAMFCSAWHNPWALFLGLKAGHAHLNLAAFNRDADGVRWAHAGADRVALDSFRRQLAGIGAPQSPRRLAMNAKPKTRLRLRPLAS